MEFLKTILGDELYGSLEQAINTYNGKPENKDKQIKIGNLAGGEYVGKGKYDSLAGEKANLDEQIKTLNSTITTLKKDNKDNETLQTTISNLNKDIENLKNQHLTDIKSYALKDALKEAGVLDPDYLIYKQGGIDKFTFDNDGKPVGVTDVVKGYKEDKSMSHLFQETQQHYNPNGGAGDNTSNPFAKDTFNLTKASELLKENPVQAKELADAAGYKI